MERSSLRILYHHRTLGDGAEGIHIIEIVKAFRRLGHDVELAGLPVTSSRSRTQRPSFVTRVRRALPRSGFEAAQCITSAATYVDMRRRISSYRPDFVYKRHAKFDFGSVLAARHSRVPLILEVNCVYCAASIRQYEPVSFPRILTRVEKWIFANADENIVVSTPLRHELLSVAQNASAVVMSNGVDHRAFAPDDALGAAVRHQLGLSNTTVIGFVGTLWRWHGLDLLVEAFARIRDSAATRLLIIGDGEMLEELRQLSRARGIENRVIFTGRVPHEKVAGYVAAMDLAVLPAEHRAHASPMKIIEYMALGKAIVAPSMPNIREIIADGVEGILFQPKDVGALTDAIERGVLDSSLRHRIGKAARIKVEGELNWDNNARKVVEIYQRIRER